MIVLTGVTGKLGGLVAERLLDRVPAQGLAVSVRDPEAARAYTDRGVRVRRGDYADPASLREAFEGAEQVFVVSSGASGEEAVRLHRNAFEAARDVGARRVLYTSHMGAGADSLFPPMRVHAATESLLDGLGISFTSLRNGFYAESGLGLMGVPAQTGMVAAPEDGPVSWATHEDLAEAAVVILLEGGLDGITPPLTGSEALNLSDLARLASETLGRAIGRTVLPDDEFRAGLVKGLPKERVAIITGLFAASRRGEFAAVDGTLARLLGRAPTSMREFLAGRL